MCLQQKIPCDAMKTPRATTETQHSQINKELLFKKFILISCRLITLQYCSGLCHTLTWISLGFTCLPHPDPPSHLPLHPIPLGLQNGFVLDYEGSRIKSSVAGRRVGGRFMELLAAWGRPFAGNDMWTNNKCLCQVIPKVVQIIQNQLAKNQCAKKSSLLDLQKQLDAPIYQKTDFMKKSLIKFHPILLFTLFLNK